MSLTSTLPYQTDELERWINSHEERQDNVRERARARIIWAEPEARTRTPYSLVYLHGFKATHPEGYPTHREVAHQLGCNLYLSRLRGHGLETDNPLGDLTCDDLMASARLAVEIGKRIGKKVVLMGTSTGASLALVMASQTGHRERISALVLYAPLIRFRGLEHYMLCTSAGRSLLKVVPGKYYLVRSGNASQGTSDPDWYSSYRLQGALALGRFVQKHMKASLFRKVRCPVFTSYYYKSSHRQDDVVSVRAINGLLKNNLGSNPKTLRFINYPEAGTHILPSKKYSRSQPKLQSDTLHFLDNLMSANNIESR